MLYVTTFYMQHCAVAVIVYYCTYFVADMYNVVCYRTTVSLYCELIIEMQFKDECERVFSY